MSEELSARERNIRSELMSIDNASPLIVKDIIHILERFEVEEEDGKSSTNGLVLQSRWIY